MSTQPQPVALIPQNVLVNAGADGKTEVFKDPAAAGLNVIRIVEEVVFDGDDEIDLSQIIPDGMKTIGFIVQPKTAFALTTATHLALGDGSDVDHFFEVAGTSFNDKNETYKEWLATPDIATADITFRLTTTNGSQTKAGSASGTLQVIIFGYTLPSVEDAA